VFLINSRRPLFFDTSLYRSPPYPEVTGSFCRVPSTTFFYRLGIFYLFTSVRLNTLCGIYIFEFTKSRWYFSSYITHTLSYTKTQKHMPHRSNQRSALRTYDINLFLRERICHLGFTFKRNSRTFGDCDKLGIHNFTLLSLALLKLIPPTNFAIDLQRTTENSTTKLSFSRLRLTIWTPVHYWPVGSLMYIIVTLY